MCLQDEGTRTPQSTRCHVPSLFFSILIFWMPSCPSFPRAQQLSVTSRWRMTFWRDFSGTIVNHARMPQVRKNSTSGMGTGRTHVATKLMLFASSKEIPIFTPLVEDSPNSAELWRSFARLGSKMRSPQPRKQLGAGAKRPLEMIQSDFHANKESSKGTFGCHFLMISICRRWNSLVPWLYRASM